MNDLCIHAAECGLFYSKACTANQISENYCGGPIKVLTFNGTCKMCTRPDLTVYEVNDDFRACATCFKDIILPKRLGRA